MPKRMLEEPDIIYPSSDGKPMAESDLHRDSMNDLIARLRDWFSDRNDVYVSGNLLVYYEEGKPKVCLAPDCFVVFGVAPGRREVYKTWQEGKFPSIVIEITSRTTMKEDLEKKFHIYQNIWQVPEYYLFDPRSEYLKNSLIGYQLMNGRYVLMPVEQGSIASSLLGITLSVKNQELLLTETRSGRIVLTRTEQKAHDAEAKLLQLQAELDALRSKKS